MEDKYSLNEFAQIMEKTKWYLLATEDAVHKFIKGGYGTVTVRYDLRSGNVEKVTVIGTEETILQPKDGMPKSTSSHGDILTVEMFSARI